MQIHRLKDILRLRLENSRTHKDRDSKTLLLRFLDLNWRIVRHTKTETQRHRHI